MDAFGRRLIAKLSASGYNINSVFILYFVEILFLMRVLRSTAFQIAAVMLLAAAWKMVFFFWDVVPFNADEAVVALMARHILQGERPVFFYGQAYMGSLDAFLVAGGFLLFGQQIWVIRMVQALLYLGTILTTIFIGKEAFGNIRPGLLGGLLLAIPTVNVTLYTTASLGGYGEALLLGSLGVLLALRLARRSILVGESKLPWLGFGLWGLLTGCGLWANGLSLVFSAPSGFYLLWALLKGRGGAQRGRWLLGFFGAAGAGFLLGSLPWWLYSVTNGINSLVLELFGTAVAVEHTPWLVRTGTHLVNFLLLGVSVIFGFRPPWNVNWLVLPLLPFALIFWSGVIWFFLRGLRKGSQDRAAYALLAGILGVVLAGFLFTPFGVDPSGRYFLPMAIPLALIAARMALSVSRRTWQWIAMLAIVVIYQLAGTLQCAAAFPPGLTTQFFAPTIIDHRVDGELMNFLREQGETRGYSNYWVSYPLAFQSKEELIFVPRLPYHLDMRYTPRDDRYTPYTAMVEGSARVAYITTNNPQLDDYLRTEFTRLGVQWQEKVIGNYQIYYHLSRVVPPGEIGLGDLQE